jgi:membrane protease YdiL (CAAX protease family)
MGTVDTKRAPRHRWSPHLRGHLLLFDRRPAPAFTAHAGVRLLLAGALLETVRLAAVSWVYPSIPLWLLLPALLGFALLVVPGIAEVRFSQLGLRPWRDWTTTERSYFLQTVVIANAVFPVVFAAPPRAWSLSNVFVPYLFFGFYQELVYRGMVQLELVRRWGAPIGIFVANVLYTFGPLHWSYFVSQASLAGPMFAAIFVMGLFFGLLYERSGNLWIVGIFHAIGNAYIVWGVGSR